MGRLLEHAPGESRDCVPWWHTDCVRGSAVAEGELDLRRDHDLWRSMARFTRRHLLLKSATAGLVLALTPYLVRANDDDDDHRRRNNVTDEPGESQGQTRENRESSNGVPPSDQVDTYEAEKDFVFTATSGNATEVAGGQLTLQRASSPDVKQFGQRMIDDHSRAYEDSKKLCYEFGVEPPTGPAEDEHKQFIQNISGLSGSAFDSFYMKGMVLDHRTDVAEYEDALKLHKDVARYANNYLPILREHLAMAEDTARKLGMDPSTF